MVRSLFVIAKTVSAKAAMSLLAWGNRPRQMVAPATSAESAVQ
jgi:hypothetical protein